MSDTGLYGSLYEQLRAYADRFDWGLIALRSQPRETTLKTRQELAALLNDIAKQESPDPATRFIGIILNRELASSSGHGLAACAALAQALAERPPSEVEMGQLEKISFVLDEECTATVARMRGRA